MKKTLVKVEPTCRYGHGILLLIHEKKDGEGHRGHYLPGYQLHADGTDDQGNIFIDGSGFTVNLYRCPECGYVELFDDEAV